MKRLAVLLLVALVAAAEAGTPRDPKTVHAFRQTHPCPATGNTTGPCHGWRVDHLVPLCWGGHDAPENMAWQTDADSFKKDAFEREACALKQKCAR